jgi:hypothetical protein
MKLQDKVTILTGMASGSGMPITGINGNIRTSESEKIF